MLLGMLLVCLTACGSEFKSDLKNATSKEISDVKTTNYLEEDQKDIEKLVKDYEKKLSKAKDDKEVEKVKASFEDELSKIPTKDSIITALKAKLRAKVESTSDDDKKKAALSEIEKLSSKMIKSKSDVDKLTKEMATKLSEILGSEVEEVKADEIKNEAIKLNKEEVSKVSVRVTATAKKESGSSSNSSPSNAPATSASSGMSSSSERAASSNQSESSSKSEKKLKKVLVPATTKKVWGIVKKGYTKEYTRPKRVYAWWIVDENNVRHTFLTHAEMIAASRNGLHGGQGEGTIDDPTGAVEVWDTEEIPDEYGEIDVEVPEHYEWVEE